MTDESVKSFNKRHPARHVQEEAPSRKRSSQIALLLMGTMAVGGGAYALMPHETCDPNQVISPGQPRQECPQRSSSSSSGSSSHSYWGGSNSHSHWGSSNSGSSSSRTNFTSSSASSGSSIAGKSSGTVARSGFGSFGSHFSGGG